ncbi:hypothetical protein AAE02nite_09760 [Adhaeribacter aerolatus]|uniref:Uncharacterized protein n=1 Tax=Adhaeribacter aerolatus TaxID=670289 RepID=A0A512AUB9_9BACT|nr:hypothetical protein [Adhaeribacter aerolatus]GEO03312.1 hypothetical protein AAE02nite_09760 [Adhaeribacter aerolatus]
MRLQPAFFLLLLTYVGLFLAGCDAPEPRTRLLFATGTGLIAGNQSVTGGNIVSTSVYAETGSGNALKNFRITCTYDNGPDSLIYLDSTLNAPEFGMFFTFATRNVPGKETWAFTISDEKNAVYRRKYTLTTTSSNIPRQPFYTYSSYFYQKSAVENLRYFSLHDGTTYPGYAVQNNPVIKAKVDFYFKQQTDESISLQAMPGSGIRFRATALSPADFSDTRTEEALVNAFATSNAALVEELPDLKKNQLLAFKTGSKSGLIRITSFDKAFDAQLKDSVLVRMRYEVKTQK